VDVSSRLVAVSFDVHDPGVVGAFWGGMLGREVVEEARGVLVPGDETQVGLRFVEETTEKSRRGRLHLHMASATSDEQRAVVQAVLRLGGRRRGTKPLPKDRDIYMADPGGKEFCVIEPGNDYLAGCGLLAEVTCDGSRQVGRFWRDALGWSIVWDQGDQLAIQSPAGGTKISWDRWPAAPTASRHGQRFDLAASDLTAEVERLVAFGATLLGDRDDGVALADPDGVEFSVSRD
jgi:hypothetical protein